MLVLNFVSVSRLELMYMSFIINIKSGHIFLHGFQLFVLLPELLEISSFVYTNKINLLYLKGNSDRKVIFAKGFLKLSNWLMLIKQKHLLLPRNLDLGFWQIARNVVNKGKSAILSLFNGPEVLHSASDWTKLLNSILDNSGIYLPAFPSRTNKKLHNISVTSKLVGRVITNFDCSKAPCPDCIAVVVLNKCKPELSYKRFLFSRMLEGLICRPIIQECWGEVYG